MNKYNSLNISSLVISSHLNKSIELLGDADHHVVVDKVPLGRCQGPLAAGLPALGCRAAEEGNLQRDEDIKFKIPLSALHYLEPHPLGVTVLGQLVRHALVEGGGVPVPGPHLVHQHVVPVAEEVVVGDEAGQRGAHHVDIHRAQVHTNPADQRYNIYMMTNEHDQKYFTCVDQSMQSGHGRGRVGHSKRTCSWRTPPGPRWSAGA